MIVPRSVGCVALVMAMALFAGPTVTVRAQNAQQQRALMMQMMQQQQRMTLEPLGGFEMQGNPAQHLPPLASALGMQIQQLDLTRNPASMFAAQIELRRAPAPESQGEGESDAAALPAGLDAAMLEKMMQGAAPAGEPPLEGDPSIEVILAQQAEAQATAQAQAQDQAREQARAAKLAQRYRLLVLAGWWPEVEQFLREECRDESGAIYHHTIAKLVQAQSELAPEEIVALANVAPEPPSMDVAQLLGELLAAARGRFDSLQPVVGALQEGLAHFGPDTKENRRRAATLLIHAGVAKEAESFLPPLGEARESGDASAFDMHAAYQLATSRNLKGRGARDARRRAWEFSREALSLAEDDVAVRDRALRRHLSMLDDVDEAIVHAWLDELFSEDSEIAWAALLQLQQSVEISRRMSAADVNRRAEAMTGQSHVAEALARAIDRGEGRWRPALDAISTSLINEANDTRLRRRTRETTYIPAEQLVSAMPSNRWLDQVDAGKSRTLRSLGVIVMGRAGRPNGALALIEPVAAGDAELRDRLCNQLLRAWGQWAKPDPERSMDDDPYAYMQRMQYYSMGSYYNPYGYPPPNTIPLTRARQQRNIGRLHDLVAQIEAMHPTFEGYESRAYAFARAHSDAEVYRLEDIEALFGPMAELPAGVATSLAQAMRTALASTWRQPQLQRRAGTNRKKPQIAQEVQRGYELALELASHALAREPENWRHAMNVAALAFDHAEFLYGQEAPLSVYGGWRDMAFDHYASACEQYRTALEAGDLEATSEPYFAWFSAALGASELGALTRLDQADTSQVVQLRGALEALGDRLGMHLELLGERLESSVGQLNPELKPRYVAQAVALIGGHDAAAPLEELLAYYDDLTDEVRLVVSVDGSASVGVEPFGVRIDIHSTQAISRESGGFSKYLRNEMRNWNTGAELNYRDDFEQSIREALADRFELQSIVFHEPDVGRVSHDRAAWDVHPLAYAVVSVVDESVDRLPALQLDMDFADGSGTVILPIASREVMIDATERLAAQAPADVTIEQVLDDREFAHGELSVEIIARSTGVVPLLEDLVDLSTLDNLELIERVDHPLNIAEISTIETGTSATTERSWLLRWRAPESAMRQDSDFTFPTPLLAEAEPSYRRFADADIVDVSSVVVLGAGSRRFAWIQLGAPMLLLAAAVVALALWIRRRRARPEHAPAIEYPAHLTPVSAFGFLRRVPEVARTPLTSDDQMALERDLSWIEESYFAQGQGPTNGDLEQRTRRWFERASASA